MHPFLCSALILAMDFCVHVHDLHGFANILVKLVLVERRFPFLRFLGFRRGIDLHEVLLADVTGIGEHLHHCFVGAGVAVIGLGGDGGVGEDIDDVDVEYLIAEFLWEYVGVSDIFDLPDHVAPLLFAEVEGGRSRDDSRALPDCPHQEHAFSGVEDAAETLGEVHLFIVFIVFIALIEVFEVEVGEALDMRIMGDGMFLVFVEAG
jgi:hypothetical protein